jgi:hypothetical protein
VINIEGELTLDDIPVFRALAAAIPKPKGIVRFDSPGGPMVDRWLMPHENKRSESACR